ncbi:MAG: pyrroline-5-carboxylate reductase, partial [Actinobacteria bacterium]|nr:pyrroline-5-carboxylate reductase [Actinomycetota bacterium]
MANYEGISEVTIIGAGTMGEAFIAALIRSGMKPSSITIVVRREEHGAELAKRYGVTVKGLAEAVTTSDVIILGIKPQGLADLLPQIQPHLKSDSLVISLLAGKTITG